MKKKRLIPLLLLRNGWLVQSKKFSEYKNLGNPTMAVKRMSEWSSDELIYLDISQDDKYDMNRDDLRDPNRHSLLDIITDVSKMAFMPLTFGGKIRSIADIEVRLAHGADKVSINTIAVDQPDFITKAANQFGSQCIIISIDVKMIDNKPTVMKGGQIVTDLEPLKWAKQVAELGAGEILLNSIDRDGMKNGFDLELIDAIASNVHIPVIACGGAGEWNHFAEVLEKTKADGVAAANIFQHIDQSVYLAKKYLFEHHLPVRPPALMLI